MGVRNGHIQDTIDGDTSPERHPRGQAVQRGGRRPIYEAVQDSVARAVDAGRLYLKVSDLPDDVLGDNVQSVLH
jgi:hypothetical protein